MNYVIILRLSSGVTRVFGPYTRGLADTYARIAREQAALGAEGGMPTFDSLDVVELEKF